MPPWAEAKALTVSVIIPGSLLLENVKGLWVICISLFGCLGFHAWVGVEGKGEWDVRKTAAS